MPGRIVTPLKPERFRDLLRDHPNRALVDFIVDGVTNGFDNCADTAERLVEHLPSAKAEEYHDVILSWLEAEQAADRIDSFDERPHPFLRASPYNRAPKKMADGSAGHRVVHNLSKDDADGDSINGSISADDFSVQYPRAQQAAAVMDLYGPDSLWSAVDLKHGFRNLPWHPSVYHLHAGLFDGRWWVDRCMGFGSRASPASFQAVTEAAAWVIQRRCDAEFGFTTVVVDGVEHEFPAVTVMVLLDDFIQICKSPSTARRAFEIMVDVLEDLGLPLQTKKTQECVSRGVYLGWCLDARAGTMSPPDDKRLAYRQELGAVLSAPCDSTMPSQLLRSLVGKLTFAHPVQRRGRPFVNEMLRKVRNAPKPFMPIRVTARLKDDCAIWSRMLRDECTISFSDLLCPDADLVPDASATGDAAGDGGFGWFEDDGTSVLCRTGRWGSDVQAHLADSDPTTSSTLQETAAMVCAALVWHGSGGRGVFQYTTDSMNLAFNAARGRSRQDRINNLLRLLSLELGAGNCVAIRWHPRTDPDAKRADLLSHDDIQGVQASLPSRDVRRSGIPASIRSTVARTLQRPTATSRELSR